jgi:hypothetical protein
LKILYSASSPGSLVAETTPALRSAALMIGPDAPDSNVRSKSMNAAPFDDDEVFTLAGY